MALRNLLNMPCQLYRLTADSVDDHGNPVEAHAAEAVEVLGFIDTAAMSNDAQADGLRHVASATALGVFDGCAGVARGDLIVDAHAARWIVDGDPVKVWSPRMGDTHHVECRLTIAE